MSRSFSSDRAPLFVPFLPSSFSGARILSFLRLFFSSFPRPLTIFCPSSLSLRVPFFLYYAAGILTFPFPLAPTRPVPLPPCPFSLPGSSLCRHRRLQSLSSPFPQLSLVICPPLGPSELIGTLDELLRFRDTFSLTHEDSLCRKPWVSPQGSHPLPRSLYNLMR